MQCITISFFFFQAEDGIRDDLVTGVQTCALPIYIGEFFRGSNDFVDSMRISGVSRDSQAFQGIYSLEPVESFGNENDIRMQSRNDLQAWVNSSAHLGLFLRVGGVIAVFAVANEMILQT